MSQISNYTFDELTIGQTASYSRAIGEKEIILFAAATATLTRFTWMRDLRPAPFSKNASLMAC